MYELIATSDNKLAVKNSAELWAIVKTNGESEIWLEMLGLL